MTSQKTFRIPRPYGLGLNLKDVIDLEDFDSQLVSGLQPRLTIGKSQESQPYSLFLTPTNCPVKVSLGTWVIDFDDDLIDLLSALDKDSTEQKKASKAFLENTLSTTWENHVQIDKAIGKSIRSSLFDQKVTIIETTAANDRSTIAVENLAANKGFKEVAKTAVSAGVGAVKYEAKKAAQPQIDKIMRDITTFSNLGSWLNRNRWILFGAVIVVGAAGTAYIVIDNTIGADKARKMLLANEEFDLSFARTKKVGKLSVGQGAISGGLTKLTFKEDVKDWILEGDIFADYQISEKLSGQHKFNLSVSSHGDVVAAPEFSLTYRWGDPSMTVGVRRGANSQDTISIGLDYKVSKGMRFFLQRDWSQSPGNFQRSTIAGWEFKLD